MISLSENFRIDALKSFRSYKMLAEKAIAQVSDEQFFYRIDAGSNSIAVIVKHIAGNLISRWTDFLTSDGEKPDRDRDSEFEIDDPSRPSLVQYWERGWQVLFDALENLTDEDMSRIALIRGQQHTVIEAVNRQLTHYAYHVGQIVLLAKHLNGESWKTLSIAKGCSGDFNSKMAARPGDDSTRQMDIGIELSTDNRK